VRACPTGARHFGDLGDPDSAVSQLVAEREGFDLLPEMGYKPVNKYLPPRPRRDQNPQPAPQAIEQAVAHSGSLADRFFRLGRQNPGALNATMHPAYSVIIFTTASGAGYGLLIWLAVAAALNLVPRDPGLGFFGLGLALALITIGLLTSTVHLGRPERAWRSLSQWKTSWLSREGIAAIVTYVPAGALGLGWVFGEFMPGQIAVGAWLSIVCALVTVWCTGMIYASLPTIRAWNQPLVAPVYETLALATGGVLLVLLLGASATASAGRPSQACWLRSPARS